MSVLLAPPTMNSGFSLISCENKTQKKVNLRLKMDYNGRFKIKDIQKNRYKASSWIASLVSSQVGQNPPPKKC